MSNCRTITIGVAALGGVALWIVLALGARGWFSSLLIAALLDPETHAAVPVEDGAITVAVLAAQAVYDSLHRWSPPAPPE